METSCPPDLLVAHPGGSCILLNLGWVIYLFPPHSSVVQNGVVCVVLLQSSVEGDDRLNLEGF